MPDVKPQNPWLRGTAFVVFGLLVFALVLLVFARLALRSEFGRNYVISKIEALQPAGQSIDISGLEGDILKDLTIKRLEIRSQDQLWLTADDVRLTWSPLKLLRGELDIDAIRAANAAMLRRPEFVPSGSEGGFDIQQIDINTIDVPAFSLSDTVLPQAQTLTVRGALSRGEEGGRLTLDASTLGAAPLDRIDANIRWSPEQLISGDAKVESRPGGIVTTLLRLKAGEALTLDMNTSGKPGDLQTQVTGFIGNREFARATLETGRDSQAVSAAFNPELIPALEAFSPVFGGQVNAEMLITENSNDRDITASLTSKNLDASSSLMRSGDGWIAENLTLTSRAPLALAPNVRARAETLTFQGRANIGESYTLTGQVSILNAAYNEYFIDAISGPLDMRLTDRSVSFGAQLAGDVTASGLRRWSGAAPRITLAGEYDVDAKRLSLSNANAALPGLKLTGAGSIDREKNRANFDGTYALAKNGLGLPTHAAFTGRFSARPTDKGIGISIKGSAQDFGELPEPLGALIGGSAAYDMRAVLSEGNTLNVTQMTASTDGVRLSGSGAVEPNGQVRAAVDYTILPFQLGEMSVSGTSGGVDLSGKPASLRFDITGEAANVSIGAQSLSNVTYSADGSMEGGAVSAAIDLTAQSPSGPAALNAQAGYDNGAWALQDMSANLLGLLVSGDVSGQGGDLYALKSDLNISGSPETFVPASAVDMTVRFANKTAIITGDISGINAGPLSEAMLNLDIRGPREAADFTAKLTGQTRLYDITRPLALTLSGQGGLAGEYLLLTSMLEGELGQYLIQSVGPLTAKQTETGYDVQAGFSVLDGTVRLTIKDHYANLRLTGEDLTLASMLALAGRPGLEGRAGFTADFKRSEVGMSGIFDAALSQVKQPGSNAEPLDATLKAVLDSGAFSLVAQSQSGALTGETRLSGALQTFPDFPFIAWPPETPLSGVMTADGNIETITELFLSPETDASAIISVAMEYNVPLEMGGMDGSMTVSGGVFEQGTAGIHLTDLAFRADFDGTSVIVSDFAAKGKKGGTLSGGGRMGLANGGSGAIRLTAKNLYAVDRREGFATLSGTLDFTQNSDTLKLSGLLNVDDASISIDKFPRAGRPTLEVEFLSDSQAKAPKVRYATELDLSIQSAGRIGLRGRGVNASLALDAKVRGPFAAPILAGSASIVRGRFDFLGKRFELKDSQIIFNDTVLDSQLDVKAVRETQDFTAAVTVTGAVGRPSVTLTSEPSLPEDEVLSYILFGRSAAQLSTLETARLAAALAQLSGGGGFDLMGGLETSLGLDTLDFSNSATGKTQLTTGKYLSDDVYVEVRSSVEGSPGLAVEWTPRQNIAVEAETSPGDTQRVSVQWKKDFD